MQARIGIVTLLLVLLAACGGAYGRGAASLSPRYPVTPSPTASPGDWPPSCQVQVENIPIEAFNTLGQAFCPPPRSAHASVDQARAEAVALAQVNLTGTPLHVRGSQLVTEYPKYPGAERSFLVWVVDMSPGHRFHGPSGPGTAYWYWAIIDSETAVAEIWFSGVGS